MFFGVVRGGARRWMAFPGLSLQPSEFARLDGRARPRRCSTATGGGAHGTSRSWPSARCIVGGAVPAHRPAARPGHRDVAHPVYLGVTYMAGLRLRWVWTALIVLLLLSPVIWTVSASRTTRRDASRRSSTRRKDPRGDGYQQIQAKITVGSGGFYGKGFLQGTQGRNGFLPVAHNDFVFSVLAEEHGFLGVLVVIGLYLFVIVRSLEAAKLARDRVGALPRRGNRLGFRVPSVVQHHHVGGVGASQGADAAAHELWRVVARGDACRVWPHPERQDAAFHELTTARAVEVSSASADDGLRPGLLVALDPVARAPRWVCAHGDRRPAGRRVVATRDSPELRA